MSPASQAEDAARAYSEWQQAVAGVLAKSRRVDAAELGPEPQKLLDTTTYDGVTVSPLYSGRDELPEAPLPGQFPFVRGADASRDVNSGWLVNARFGQDTQDAAASTAPSSTGWRTASARSPCRSVARTCRSPNSRPRWPVCCSTSPR